MNLINAALGVLLIYSAILNPAYVTEQRGAALTLAVALIVILFAYLGQKSTAERWQVQFVMMLGIVLALQAGLRWFLILPAVVNTWLVFWIGIFTSILSLWAMLYHPESDAV